MPSCTKLGSHGPQAHASIPETAGKLDSHLLAGDGMQFAIEVELFSADLTVIHPAPGS